MAEKQFSMTATQIANIIGTVASPLIVVSELIKNAVDVSARNIDILYDKEHRCIIVENDHKGFSFEEIETLSTPGASFKKAGSNLTNEYGMFLTGSKGLGLLSVFLLCDEAEIITAPADQKIHKILLNKINGTVEDNVTEQKFEKPFTKIILKNVNQEVIDFLSSESEVKKLRHICSYLYKRQTVPFPKMFLHISNQAPEEINFSCDFPTMLYDVSFHFQKDSGELKFCCNSPNKPINNKIITLKEYRLTDLEKVMLDHYEIKNIIPTRTNDTPLTNFNEVPSFEGRILVYEKNLAGAQLKTYGAGVNIYVNDFALYNYLAEENDWLGLADYSQRKKATRLKPHNVFGYVNFPKFDENSESLKISNERADFIQDLIYVRLMYLLKGVVIFMILNIDIADKNPKYKNTSNDNDSTTNNYAGSEENTTANSETKTEQGNNEDDHEQPPEQETDIYSPENAYKPRQNIRNNLDFTIAEGKIISSLKDSSDLGNKIYNIVFELSKLDLQIHRYSIVYLFRALIESSTKYFCKNHTEVPFIEDGLESAVVKVLEYFANTCKDKKHLSSKTIDTWKNVSKKQKLFDTLNDYIHNSPAINAYLIQESWNTMKGYIIACLTE